VIASLGGIAVLVAAIVWGALVVVLFFVFIQLGFVLQSTRSLVDGIRQETVPLLSEVTTSVSNVNKELDRADGILESAGNIARSAERVTSVIEHAVSGPLIKVIAVSAGASLALRRLRKKKG
jgi:hypothetical protein